MKHLKQYENKSEYKKGDYVQININDIDEVMLIHSIIPLSDSVNQYEGTLLPSIEIEFVTNHNIIKKLTTDEVNLLINVNKYNL